MARTRTPGDGSSHSACHPAPPLPGLHSGDRVGGAGFSPLVPPSNCAPPPPRQRCPSCSCKARAVHGRVCAAVLKPPMWTSSTRGFSVWALVCSVMFLQLGHPLLALCREDSQLCPHPPADGQVVSMAKRRGHPDTVIKGNPRSFRCEPHSPSGIPGRSGVGGSGGAPAVGSFWLFEFDLKGEGTRAVVWRKKLDELSLGTRCPPLVAVTTVASLTCGPGGTCKGVLVR